MPATLSEPAAVRRPATDALTGTPRAHGLDRWIFVGMALWFVAIALAGFVPSSIAKLAQVEAGVRPAFPLGLHVHAVLMGSFLCVLLVQSWLMATGRAAYHMQLGLLGFALACAVIVGGFLAIGSRHQSLVDAWHAAAPEQKAAVGAAIDRAEKIAFRGLLVITTLFAACMAIAFRSRRDDPGLHKRLIFLAVAVPLAAATNRIGWLPSTRDLSTFSTDAYTFLMIAPLFAWDVVRNRRVHRAYGIWLALFVPLEIAVNLLAGTPWWHATFRAIFGPV